MRFLASYLKILLDHFFWSVSHENIEVQDASDSPVGYCWGWLNCYLFVRTRPQWFNML